jgi:hypothetical protein
MDYWFVPNMGRCIPGRGVPIRDSRVILSFLELRSLLQVTLNQTVTHLIDVAGLRHVMLLHFIGNLVKSSLDTLRSGIPIDRPLTPILCPPAIGTGTQLLVLSPGFASSDWASPCGTEGTGSEELDPYRYQEAVRPMSADLSRL